MPGAPRLPVEGSWVLEGGDESPSIQPEDDGEGGLASPRASPKRTRQSVGRLRNRERSPDPEFIMPSMSVQSIETSLAEAKNTSTGIASGAKSRSRRRKARQDQEIGSPVERRKLETQSDSTSSKAIPFRNAATSLSAGNQDLVAVLFQSVTSVLAWLLEIFFGALRVLKTPLTYLFAVWLLFGFTIVLRNMLTNVVQASLSPLCRLPGATYLDLPFCPVQGPPNPVEFDRLMQVQSNFENVLEESAGGVSLPLDMKRGEASIRDLRQLVRYSALQSKSELVLEFDGFIETARIASYDLQKFNSHVGRAVDGVIATTRWTTRVLDDIQDRDSSRGAIDAFVNDKVFGIFQPVRFTESLVLDQYIKHTHRVEEEIHKLIEEAQVLLMTLNNLEDRLEVIYGIAIRDDMHATAAKEEILAQLWTMLGGNRGKLNKMDRQLGLLKEVGNYRKTAYAHVSGTILRLQGMGTGLEDLRERVGSPELMRHRNDIPLAVHIENIQRGVERLEQGRLDSRKSENDLVKQTFEGSHTEGNLIDG